MVSVKTAQPQAQYLNPPPPPSSEIPTKLHYSFLAVCFCRQYYLIKMKNIYLFPLLKLGFYCAYPESSLIGVVSAPL